MNDSQVKELNNVVKLRGKIRSLKFSNSFLKKCGFKRVSPRFINKRCGVSELEHSIGTRLY